MSNAVCHLKFWTRCALRSVLDEICLLLEWKGDFTPRFLVLAKAGLSLIYISCHSAAVKSRLGGGLKSAWYRICKIQTSWNLSRVSP